MLNIQRFVVNPFQENCYIVSDSTGEAVIVDCGAFYPEERQAVVNYIRDNGLTPVHLIATHGHIDHNFGNDTIFSAFGLQPEIHSKDSGLMDRMAEQAMALCNYKMDNESIPAVGRLLADDDTVEFGNHKFTMLHTPGHTPGSVFFYCKEEKVAFSGDTLFQMSIGRTDLWQGSYADIMSSLRHVNQKLPAETTILPGHGPQTTMADELRSNPYLK